MKHATGRRILLLCAAVASLLGGLLPPAVAAEPTTLTANTEASTDGIVVSGTLTSNGEPVGGATVDVAVESIPATSATTDETGTFLAITVANPSTPHTVQVSFAGTEQLHASSIRVEFVPVPVQAVTAVSAQVADDTLYPGELLAITGSLEANGDPVPNGEINVFVAGREQTESLAFTGTDGRFATYAEVPTDLSAGATSLRVIHPGTGRTQASESTITLTIQQPAPTPTGEQTPAQDPTPAEDPTTARAEASIQESAEADVEPAVTAEAGAEEPTNTTNPFSWFWVGAVVVAGCAALVTIALLMRRAATREEKRERDLGIEPLYLLGDDVDADYRPEDHGWVTEEIPVFEDDPKMAPDAPGETTQSFPAPASPIRPAPEPGPSIYRDEEPAQHQPKPRRSWSGEE